MEQFLNQVNALRDCYSRYPYEDVMQMSKNTIQHLCLDEKLALNQYLHSNNMKTSNMINERLNIIRENNSLEAARRLEFLQETFGRK